MIVSASRRTDIPAFFSKWFINRVHDGFVLVRNPMNPYQISRIDLSPQVVDCIVFWTKNPHGILPYLDTLKEYNFYFQFTINAYGKALEPNVPPVDRSIDMFLYLSKHLGSERIIWRYDPIFFTEKLNIDWHVSAFTKLAQALSNYTRKCVISFLDMYKKCERNLLGVPLQNIDENVIQIISQKLVQIAHSNRIELNTCAEETDLSSYGITSGKCIDDKLIEEISGLPLSIGKDKTQRHECGCVASIDIGSYNTCPHSCLYCYANYNSNTVRKNYAQHDPLSPLLFGQIGERDRIKDRKVSSCFEIQKKLL